MQRARDLQQQLLLMQSQLAPPAEPLQEQEEPPVAKGDSATFRCVITIVV